MLDGLSFQTTSRPCSGQWPWWYQTMLWLLRLCSTPVGLWMLVHSQSRLWQLTGEKKKTNISCSLIVIALLLDCALSSCPANITMIMEWGLSSLYSLLLVTWSWSILKKTRTSSCLGQSKMSTCQSSCLMTFHFSLWVWMHNTHALCVGFWSIWSFSLQGITSDLFPGVELPEPDYSILAPAVRENCEKLNLQCTKVFLEKALQVRRRNIHIRYNRCI